jgi:tRNA pseudouridine38-40 synthase
MLIGQSIKPVSWLNEVLEAKNRCVAGVTAPSAGLYFVDVDYPLEFDIPKRNLGPLFLS